MTDRIQRILKSKGFSPSQFADEIGIQRSSISHILSGRNKPSLDFILKTLSHFKDLDAEWLLFGTGRMLKKEEKNTMPEEADQGMQPSSSPPDHFSEKNQHIARDILNEARSSEEVYYGEPIERIVIFYANNTFKTYSQRNQ